MSKKLIIFLLFSSIILLSTAGYFFFKLQKEEEKKFVPTITPVAEVKTEIYESDVLGFELSLPEDLTIEEKTEGKVVLIGDKIIVYELLENPENCKTDCPVIKKREDKTINNIKGRLLEGYWEETETTNAQSFVSFIVSKNEKYLVFTLQELPFNTEYEKDRKIGTVDPQELFLVLANLKLNNS